MESTCPACAAPIKFSSRSKQRRIQCPNCREIVLLEKAALPAAEHLPSDAAPGEMLEGRLEALEKRIASLEKSLAQTSGPVPTPGPAASTKQDFEPLPPLSWQPQSECPVTFSPEKAEKLRRRLDAIKPHRIIILFPTGDSTARSAAGWFQRIFEHARWDVVVAPYSQLPYAVRGLTFASSLPVAPVVAATYLALQTAGFLLSTGYDPDLSDDEQRLIVA